MNADRTLVERAVLLSAFGFSIAEAESLLNELVQFLETDTRVLAHPYAMCIRMYLDVACAQLRDMREQNKLENVSRNDHPLGRDPYCAAWLCFNLSRAARLMFEIRNEAITVLPGTSGAMPPRMGLSFRQMICGRLLAWVTRKTAVHIKLERAGLFEVLYLSVPEFLTKPAWILFRLFHRSG